MELDATGPILIGPLIKSYKSTKNQMPLLHNGGKVCQVCIPAHFGNLFLAAYVIARSLTFKGLSSKFEIDFF